jgi:hypothetical protein
MKVAVADGLDITVTDDGCGISADTRRRSGLAHLPKKIGIAPPGASGAGTSESADSISHRH